MTTGSRETLLFVFGAFDCARAKRGLCGEKLSKASCRRKRDPRLGAAAQLRSFNCLRKVGKAKQNGKPGMGVGKRAGF